MPARPDRLRLLFGSCSSARRFAPRFLPTVCHHSAVALHFVRRGQLTGGLAPPRVRPCWAHKAKTPVDFSTGVFWCNSLTITYFHTGCSTIIGAESFHGPVRDGKEWFQHAMVIRHEGVTWCGDRCFGQRNRSNWEVVGRVVLLNRCLSC